MSAKQKISSRYHTRLNVTAKLAVKDEIKSSLKINLMEKPLLKSVGVCHKWVVVGLCQVTVANLEFYHTQLHYNLYKGQSRHSDMFVYVLNPAQFNPDLQSRIKTLVCMRSLKKSKFSK